jgi:hypothetical protein
VARGVPERDGLTCDLDRGRQAHDGHNRPSRRRPHLSGHTNGCLGAARVPGTAADPSAMPGGTFNLTVHDIEMEYRRYHRFIPNVRGREGANAAKELAST